MSTKDTEINRRIDGETAEGHARNVRLEDAEVRTKLDDDAEGHARATMDEAELRASKRAQKRSNTLDDEAEGHARARE